MNKVLSATIIASLMLQSALAAAPANREYELRHRVRIYSKTFRDLNRFLTQDASPEKKAEIEAQREGISNLFLSPTANRAVVTNPLLALAYIHESVLENTFNPGAGRDPSVDLNWDYRRSMDIGEASREAYLTGMSIFRHARPQMKDVQNLIYSCARSGGCTPKIRALARDHSDILNLAPTSPLFWSNDLGSCVGDGSVANIKIAMLVKALMKRGRIRPLTTGLRHQLAATHSFGDGWIRTSEDQKSTNSRLSRNLPKYETLGVYDCKPDENGLSGTIYIDPTLNPFDLATLVLHELNHFAADKFVNFDQHDRVRQLTPSLVGYLEDVGSYTLSALSQIDQTISYDLNRMIGNPQYFSSAALLPQSYLGFLMRDARSGMHRQRNYPDLSQYEDYGDLSRFNRNLRRAGAINSYIEAEEQLAARKRTERLGSVSALDGETPLCKSIDSIPEVWKNDVGQSVEDRQENRTQNILHQIHNGCHKEVNLSKVQIENPRALFKFNYTPILQLLTSSAPTPSWSLPLRTKSDFLALEARIQEAVDNALRMVSPSCKHTRLGTDGGKPGSGLLMGTDGGKSGGGLKPGVDGGKPGSGIKTGVDGGKSGRGIKTGSDGGKAARGIKTGADGGKAARDLTP